MQYRKFSRLGLQISALGFGCMRFPTLGKPGQIDEAEAIKMLRYAIDNGVNYIDTAWPYHRETSETLVGQALRQGYRGKVYLATKSPVFQINHVTEYDEYLDRQLTKLQTYYIDFYLLHALNKARWEKCLKDDISKFISRGKESGKIRYIGFSFHDSLPVFKEIVDAYDWDFCQIQYNYMDEKYQAGRKGLEYAAGKGLPVIIMEPLLGGRLAEAKTTALEAIWSNAPGGGSPAEWALRWLWDQPEVSLVLSGMSTMDQVQENIRSAAKAAVGSLTKEEIEVIHQARDYYRAKTKVECTGCGYCAGCPAGIDIEKIFTLYNEASMYSEAEKAGKRYQKMKEAGKDFSHCLDCSQCEDICPQNLKVRHHLRDFHAEFNSDSNLTKN